jgi:hypothetical protein
MQGFLVKSLVVAATWNVSVLLAATLPIGVAVSDAPFRLNGNEASGSVTVFDGSSFQTGPNGATIRLQNGGRILFFADSRGTLSGNKLLLEQGSVKVTDYPVLSNRLDVSTDAVSAATVSVKGKGIQVAALTGNVRVFSAAGLNVANMVAGEALNLETQESGANAPSVVSGCVTKVGSSYVLTDSTSKISVVLHGSNLKAGQRVEATGTMMSEPAPISGASEGLNVLKLNVLGGGCKEKAMATAGAGAAGSSAAAGAGIASSTTAVVAGVAVAAATSVTSAVLATQTNSTATNLSPSR